MKRRKPKRLQFRKVKRKKPPLSWQAVRLHLGNGLADVSGCIMLSGEAFRGVALSIERAAAGIGAAVAALGVRLGQPRHLVHIPAGGYQFTGTVHLQQHELRWLQNICTNPAG